MGNLLDYYKGVNQDLESKGKTPAFKITQKGDLYTIAYMHGGIDFSDESARMARGLTLDKEGKIILRGFNKFFNYHQLNDYDNYTQDFKDQYANVHFEEGKWYPFVEKMDGSLIILGVYQGQLITGTTSSIENDYTQFANDYFNHLEGKEDLIHYLEERGFCACFEWIGPQNRVVVSYPEEDYVSLALIEKETGVRHQLDSEHLDFVNRFGFTTPEIHEFTFPQIQDFMHTATGLEGFVLENQYGNLIKFKTDDWFKASRTYSIFFGFKITKEKIRVLINAYFDDTLDDLQGHSQIGDDLIKTVVPPIKELEEEIYQLYVKLSHNYPEVNQLKKQVGLGDYPGLVKSRIFSLIQGDTTVNQKQREQYLRYLKDKVE